MHVPCTKVCSEHKTVYGNSSEQILTETRTQKRWAIFFCIIIRLVDLTFIFRLRTVRVGRHFSINQKLIVGFSGDISADNALQVSAIRHGLVMHIYTNLMQQSIFKTAKMVAFIHEGVCGNINALKTSIQKLME